MGDPETQPILMRLSSDLLMLLEAGISGRLDQIEAKWDRRTALAVVMAAAGYPDAPRKGDVIEPLPANAEDVQIFHAGTTLDRDTLKVSGGRVLAVTALGDSLRIAQARATKSPIRCILPAARCVATLVFAVWNDATRKPLRVWTEKQVLGSGLA